MTHQQMINMGFELSSIPFNDPNYTFDNLCFIPKRSIYRLRRKHVLILIYSAGLKQGTIIGRNQTLKS